MGVTVVLSRLATKQLRIVPDHVVVKLHAWVRLVESRGLAEARKLPGFHDEPLKGQRAGQRSIRLSRAYRAIYTVSPHGDVEIVTVQEVTKHDY
jgi:proteic killer suppression protein